MFYYSTGIKYEMKYKKVGSGKSPLLSKFVPLAPAVLIHDNLATRNGKTCKIEFVANFAPAFVYTMKNIP